MIGLVLVSIVGLLGGPASADVASGIAAWPDDLHRPSETAAGPDDRYRPPVSGPVVDPFRPPEERWGAGNRGVKYDTEPGERVGAIGPGTITYAGRIGGDLHVTVTHPDGLRSSYSFLASIRVREGDRVRTGDTVGTAGERLHLGVRHGDEYVDPESVIGTPVGTSRLRLVPTDGADDHRPAASSRDRSPEESPMRTGPTSTGLGVRAVIRLASYVGSSPR